jgi:HEAT repeat protein/ATP/ADP translocase
VLGISLKAELERTLLLSALLFLAALVLVVGRTARDALFLTRFPVSWVAPMWMIYAAVSSLAAIGYSKVERRLPRVRFAVAFTMFGAVSYAILRVLIAENVNAAYAVFYVWSEVIANFTAVLAWTVAQDLHDARSAKRLFGWIGMGRVAGIVVSGFATGAIVGAIGTENLFFVLIAALVAFAIVTVVIARRHPLAAPASVPARLLEPQSGKAALRNGYVVSLAAMTLLLFAALTVGDYQFKALARTAYPERDDLAQFMGNFYGVVGLVGLLLQPVVTPRLLERYGVLGGLLAMPIAFVASTLGLVLHPSLVFAALVKGSDNGLQFTVYDATMQLLFFPFPASIRDRIRTLVGAIVKPLGYGLGAILLVLLAPGADTVPGDALVVAAAELGRYTIPIGMVVIALTFLVRSGYVDAMHRTLVRHQVEPLTVVDSPQVRTLLREALQSADSPRVLFAIDRLRAIDPPMLAENLPGLTRHASPDVRAAALRLGPELDDPRTTALAREALADPSDAVRIAAVEAIATRLREDAHEELVRLSRRTDDAAVSTAAIAALLRSCGLDGMLDGAPRLRTLIDSTEPSDRKTAARVLGMVGEASLQRALAQLITDADPEVRRAAVQASSNAADPRLLPLLLDALADRALAPAAERAIEALGEASVDPLAARLDDASTPRIVRLRIPRMLSRISRSAALGVLLDRIDEPDDMLRQKILASASRLRLAIDAPAAPLQPIRERILREIGLHEAQRDSYLAVRPLVQQPLLDEHLLRRMRKSIIRVLRLCELAYPREIVAAVRAHLFGPNPTLRANAFEVLESLLDGTLRRRLVGAAERFLALRSAGFPAGAAPQGESDAARWISGEIDSGDPYRAALALDAVGWHRIGSAATLALQATSHPDPLVRETAAIAVAVTQPEGARGALRSLLDDRDAVVARYAQYWAQTGQSGLDPHDTMYTTLEKVLFLQRVPVFSRAAGEDLSLLARDSVVVTPSEGEAIFRAGDAGDALFFVISGAVKLYVEGHEVAELRENDVLGEMSIFDREPRIATAVAATDVELLRVSAEDFHEAMRETTEIAEAVIQVLNRRLRDADRRLAARSEALAEPGPDATID